MVSRTLSCGVSTVTKRLMLCVVALLLSTVLVVPHTANAQLDPGGTSPELRRGLIIPGPPIPVEDTAHDRESGGTEPPKKTFALKKLIQKDIVTTPITSISTESVEKRVEELPKTNTTFERLLEDDIEAGVEVNATQRPVPIIPADTKIGKVLKKDLISGDNSTESVQQPVVFPADNTSFAHALEDDINAGLNGTSSVTEPPSVVGGNAAVERVLEEDAHADLNSTGIQLIAAKSPNLPPYIPNSDTPLGHLIEKDVEADLRSSGGAPGNRQGRLLSDKLDGQPQQPSESAQISQLQQQNPNSSEIPLPVIVSVTPITTNDELGGVSSSTAGVETSSEIAMQETNVTATKYTTTVHVSETGAGGDDGQPGDVTVDKQTATIDHSSTQTDSPKAGDVPGGGVAATVVILTITAVILVVGLGLWLYSVRHTMHRRRPFIHDDQLAYGSTTQDSVVVFSLDELDNEEAQEVPSAAAATNNSGGLNRKIR